VEIMMMELLTGNFVQDANSVIVNGSSTLEINGGTYMQGDETLTVAGNMSVYGGGTFTGSTYDIDVDGTLYISGSGTSFTSTSGVLYVEDHFWFDHASLATFDNADGIVELDGSTAQVTGDITWHDLRLDTVGMTVNFNDGDTQTFETGGDLIIAGGTGAGEEVKLRSVSGGSWNITDGDPSPNVGNITEADVQDSACVATNSDWIWAGSSIDNGDNGDCWVFSAEAYLAASSAVTEVLDCEDIPSETYAFASDEIGAYTWTVDPDGVSGADNWMEVNIPFNSGSTQEDFSGNNDDGTFPVSPNDPAYDSTPANCVVGGCAVFDGDDYMNFSTLDMTGFTESTIAMWVEIDDASVPGAGYKFFSSDYDTVDDIRFGYEIGWVVAAYDDGVTDGAAVAVSWNDNEWHHIAATQSNADGTLVLYIDGQEVDRSSSGSNFDYAGLNNLHYLGRRVIVGQEAYLEGSIDEFQLYDHSLSAAQIEQLYDDGVAGLGGPTIIKSDETVFDNVWDLDITEITDAGAVGSTRSSENTVTVKPSVCGFVYSDEGITAFGSEKQVSASINGGAVGTQFGDTDDSGEYKIELSSNPVAGQPVTAFLDDETEKAVTVSVLDAASPELDLYQNYLIVRHESEVIIISRTKIWHCESTCTIPIEFPGTPSGILTRPRKINRFFSSTLYRRRIGKGRIDRKILTVEIKHSTTLS